MNTAGAANPAPRSRVLPWLPGELAATLTAFLAFACILFGYYLLRPIRDAWAIERSANDLRYFFLYTLVAMLVVLPFYWWLIERATRRTFLTATFIAISAATLVFAWLLHRDPANVAGAASFFVFLSVINLFIVSVFWSVMADAFDREQAPRLFGFIAGGGSLGAITGPALAAALVGNVQPPALMVGAAVMFLAALAAIRRLLGLLPKRIAHGGRAPIARDHPLTDLLALVRSRYLLAIVIMLLIAQVAANLVYQEQARAVAATYATLTERTALFARIDLWVNLSALALQLVIGHTLVRRIGFRATLTLMPVIAALSFLGLALVPTLTMLIVTQVMRRAGEYGLFRPARETLFTAVAESAKYRSKSLIDTVVHRGGDALGAFVHGGLTHLGLALAGLAAVGAGLCAVLIGLASWIGKEFTASKP